MREIVENYGIALSAFGVVQSIGAGDCEVTVKVFDRGEPRMPVTRITSCNQRKLIGVIRELGSEAASLLTGGSGSARIPVQPVEPVGPRITGGEIHQGESGGSQISGGEIADAIGYLTVEGSPRGARVEVLDRRNRQAVQPCVIPCRMVTLSPGVYTVKLAANGYEAETHSATIRVDRTENLQIGLKRPGSLSITGSPTGSKVVVTGPDNFQDTRGLPWRAQGLARGTYRVEVSQALHETYTQTHEVRPGEETKVEVALKRFGSLKIGGSPRGAKVIVTGPNGFKVERGLPLEASDLESGTYHVTVSRTGYVSQEKDLSVSPGTTVRWTDVKLISVEDARQSADFVTIGRLTWQKQATPNKMDWSNAKRYCANLSLGGYSDWRLPSISELRSVIRGCGGSGKCGNQSVSNSACSNCSSGSGPANGCYWPNEFIGKCSWFWSSSSYEGYVSRAWYVAFDHGRVSYYIKYLGYYVRCVRGRP